MTNGNYFWNFSRVFLSIFLSKMLYVRDVLEIFFKFESDLYLNKAFSSYFFLFYKHCIYPLRGFIYSLPSLCPCSKTHASTSFLALEVNYISTKGY